MIRLLRADSKLLGNRATVSSCRVSHGIKKMRSYVGVWLRTNQSGPSLGPELQRQHSGEKFPMRPHKQRSIILLHNESHLKNSLKRIETRKFWNKGVMSIHPHLPFSRPWRPASNIDPPRDTHTVYHFKGFVTPS